MITVEALSKYYGDIAAVTDLSFSVKPGEVLGLVGPNGAGKTTTLRCIAGIVRPTKGAISIAGHDLASDVLAAKQRLSFIPDEPHLFDYLTVDEHLQFIARLYRVVDADAISPGLLEELELAEKRDAFPDELSRGMRQKLAIACGLLHQPDVLIFDEPLTGLDPSAIRRLRLGAAGHPIVAIVWKNTLLFFGQLRPTAILVLLGLLVGATAFLSIAVDREFAATMLGVFSLSLLAMTTLFGALAVRADLRCDLGSLELLKTLPVGGRRLVAAEIAAPALGLAICQALLLALGLVAVVLGPMDTPSIEFALIVAAAAAIVLLPVNAIFVAIQNAIALLWPAWTHIGRHQPGGVENMGRMLLTMLVTMLAALISMLLPAVAGIVFWAVLPGSGPLALAGATVAAASVATLELGLVVSWLGRVYDGLDPVDAGLL